MPHWQQPGATYFLTYHLADSIPRDLREAWAAERAAWLRQHPVPWDTATEREYHRRFSAAIERWLDAGYGSCALRNPEAAQTVAECLAHFDGERYTQHAWVVMPNHVHLVFLLALNRNLERVVHTWKSYTAHRLAANLEMPSPFWQEDYFDRIAGTGGARSCLSSHGESSEGSTALRELRPIHPE